MKQQLEDVDNYWAEVQQTMLEVCSITEQNKMSVNDFYRHLKVWEKRARQRVENLKK